MILGFDFWGEPYSTVFSTRNPVKKPTKVELTNASFNELNLSNEMINPTSISSYSHVHTEWSDENIFLAEFKGDLSAGNVKIKDKSVTHIKLLKRKSENEMWEVYKIIDFNPKEIFYDLSDKFVEAEETYQYKIIPMNTEDDVHNITPDMEASFTDGVNLNPQSFYVSYDYAHIFDKENDYSFIYNLELAPLSHHIGSNTVETLGNRYPYIVYQGNLDYVTGSIKCILVADNMGGINKKNEKELRQKVEKFLCDKKPKGFRNSDGRYMAISILGTPQFTPNNNLIGLYEVSFEYIEIGKLSDMKSLVEFNLIDDYRLYNSDYIEKASN